MASIQPCPAQRVFHRGNALSPQPAPIGTRPTQEDDATAPNLTPKRCFELGAGIGAARTLLATLLQGRAFYRERRRLKVPASVATLELLMNTVYRGSWSAAKWSLFVGSLGTVFCFFREQKNHKPVTASVPDEAPTPPAAHPFVPARRDETDK